MLKTITPIDNSTYVERNYATSHEIENALNFSKKSFYDWRNKSINERKEILTKFGSRINTGTFFMNRCDYLDPGLAWTGVKNTGTGVTLSVLGFDHVTRVKSYHYRTI